MRISVITISYCDLVGLHKTRASVEEQTWDDIEHLIVDGGSGPETQSYLASLESVLSVSEPDQGRYDAMNKGIRMASGDLLWFMNSGDTFGSKDSLRIVAELLEGRRDAAPFWGYGVARKVDATGVCVGLFGDVPFSLRRFSLGGHPIPHQAAFFSRELIDVVGEYDLNHGLAADQLYMLKCAVQVPPLVIAEMLCNFDIGGAGSTRSVGAHFRDMRRARRSVGFSPGRSAAKDELWSSLQRGVAVAKRFLGGRTR